MHVMRNFKIVVANGGAMKCGGHCEMVWLQMGDYSIKTHKFGIDMGGCVLGTEWLQKIGLINMDFSFLYMSFQYSGHKYTLKEITTRYLELVSSHNMEKFHKKGNSCGTISCH